ncbi:hypothetical protein GO495_27315 [Chitinophaga oryziterrae]|uniref:Uncharacterized protein n=1 Tax=Chitinophaga oryziterrae TaxID=1031224 RepID=A0A6N8JH88_9BACT|nr:hypothetical protein [Chitinophaga oryziterrae]MVT44334.1 hypothetical protein [Chitinophaga oryziterrae]
MIRPHPESDLQLNVMVLGSNVITLLKSKSKNGDYILLENIINDFLKADKKRTPDLFIYTLLFLYSIGLIDYKGYKIKLTPNLEKHPNLFD